MNQNNFDFGITPEMTGQKKSSFYNQLQQFKQMKSLLQRVNDLMDQDDVDIMDSMIIKSDIENLLKKLKQK